MLKEELVEVEYDDEDILYYIDDEQGNEIGFAVLEDGEEVEYFYADDTIGGKAYAAVGTVVDGVVGGVKDAVNSNPILTRQEVAGLKGDLNALYKENAGTVKELRSFGEDLRDLKDLFSGKPLKPRAEKTAETAAVAAVVSDEPKKKKKDKDKKKKKKEKAVEAPIEPTPAPEPEQ